MRTFLLVLAVFACVAAISSPPSAAATAAKKPHQKSYTAGHAQLAGGNGEFGVVYSFKSHWNEEILAARYSVDPFCGYGDPLAPRTGQKLLVLDIALKNPTADSEWFNDEQTNQIVAVDQNGA